LVQKDFSQSSPPNKGVHPTALSRRKIGDTTRYARGLAAKVLATPPRSG